MVWSAVPPRLWIQPEVIHRFILSPVTEPLTVLTPCTAQHIFHPIDPPAEPNTGIGLVWCMGQAWIRILDLVRNQLEHTIDLSSPVPSTSRGLDVLRLVRERCDKRRLSPPSCHAACASDADRSTSAILLRCMLELGRSNPTTSACHEPHSCLQHFSSRP